MYEICGRSEHDTVREESLGRPIGRHNRVGRSRWVEMEDRIRGREHQGIEAVTPTSKTKNPLIASRGAG